MASKPWLDARRKTWFMKYRPERGGPWVRVPLCKHEGRVHPDPSRNKIPHEGAVKHREFADVEFRAKHALAPAANRPRGLSEYLDAYALARAATSAANSIRDRRDNIRRFVAFAEGKGVTTLQGVTRATCREYLEMRLRTVKPSSVKTERGFLIGAWSVAVADELIPANPWTKAKPLGAIAPTEVTFWTGDEITAIVAECEAPWLADLVELMANTGLRVSTALVSRWDWIDPAGGVLKIRKQPRVKTAYTHVLSEAARAILARRREAAGGSPFVFPPPNGTGIAYETARLGIARAVKKSGVRRGTCHDFRHSYGRTLGLAGVPVTVIQRQLGHANLSMTLRYVTVDEDHVGRFVESVAVGVKPPDRPGT